MKQKRGRLRLYSVFAAAALLIGYRATALSGGTFPVKEEETPVVSFLKTEENGTVMPQADTENEPKQDAPSTDLSQAVTTASGGTVKGKVISRYISPYTAPLSFDGVYLKNNTSLSVDIRSLLSEPLTFGIQKNGQPQVLILHTHTTETYLETDCETYTAAYTSRSRDPKKNMIAVGEIVAKKLNDAGIKTLHDTTEHDYPQYTGSYSNAAETISSYLKKYPGIKIVLDLHRDAISSGETDKVKTVTEIEGKKAAQVMLVMGSQSGGVTNFPNWKENLKLAVRLQRVMEKKYPTLARPISLMSKNYNESFTTGSLLIEIGTDANSIAEAHTSAAMVGECLVSLLNGL